MYLHIHCSEDDTETPAAKVESLCDYMYGKDVRSLDINSDQFRSLPPSIRHEILSELIETRKQSSWGRFQEMKKVGDTDLTMSVHIEYRTCS